MDFGVFAALAAPYVTTEGLVALGQEAEAHPRRARQRHDGESSEGIGAQVLGLGDQPGILRDCRTADSATGAGT